MYFRLQLSLILHEDGFLLIWFFIILQIKALFAFVYDKLKLKQLIQPPIIASVSYEFCNCSYVNVKQVFNLLNMIFIDLVFRS